jgi:hypothetical protein
MLEYLAPGFVYSLFKDGVAVLRSRRHHLSPSELLALRQKWKDQFEAHIVEHYQRKLRSDVIVRDVKRIDNYPDIDEASKGISPWFRVGLVGTYYRGILLGLRWGALTKEGESWRFTNRDAGESGDIKVMLIGRVPYENIEYVDWHGDEYYGYPHIYCSFSFKKEPYERLGFYTETVPPHGIPFFSEVEDYKSVRRRSLKRGIQHFS